MGIQDPAAASRVAKYKRIMLKVSGEALQGEWTAACAAHAVQ
jgi:hypothetical protein